MLHIYRQITRLERVWPVVIAQKREKASAFHSNGLTSCPKSPTHDFLRRFWFRTGARHAVADFADELNALLRVWKDRTRNCFTFISATSPCIYCRLSGPGRNRRSFPFMARMFWWTCINRPIEKPPGDMLDAVKRWFWSARNHLRRAVVDLGCDERKIDIQRTGIPLDEFPFRERSFPERRRVAIGPGLSIDRKERAGQQRFAPSPISWRNIRTQN